MARIYANGNFPLPTVEALRALGHDVLTTEEVLAFANGEQRILLTINRKHFIRLHQLQPHHYGIIVCTFDLDFTALAIVIPIEL
jgi:hypothetical protein